MNSKAARQRTNDQDGPSSKRARTGDPSDATKTKLFDGVPAIQAALSANEGQPSAGLIESLTALRNELSLRHNELQALIDNSQATPATSTSKGNSSGSYLNALPTVIQPNDPRLLLLEKWCTSSPGLEGLFNVWDQATASVPSWSKSSAANQGPAAMANSISSLALNILTSILTLLSAYYTFHPHAYPVLKNVFEGGRWRRICGYLSGNGNDLILGTLRLLAVIVEQWDGKKVLEAFSWESKSLAKLLQMRRKGSSTQSGNMLIKPDIRTAYTQFLISFLLPSNSANASSNSQTKTAFLQQHSFHYTSIFKNLHQDQPAVVRRVLEVSWEGVWCDIKVSRSLKVGVFAGGVLQNLLKLYERSSEEEDGFAVADLVHHFLLAICTRPGVGLCFKDRGWYPRDVGVDTLFNEGEDDDASTKAKPKIYNPVLLTLLKLLKPTDDPRQNELALKILGAAPELVSMYLPHSGLTLDPPRLSSKWIANLSFFVSVVGASGNIESMGGFRMDSTAGGAEVVYRPTPPPLTAIVNNVAPGGGVTRLNMRNVFNKGLQFVASGKGTGTSGSGAGGNLVQHTTALGLIRCLDKLRKVREAMEGVSRALGEGEGLSAEYTEEGAGEAGFGGVKEGLWAKRAKEVVKEIRRRVPEFQVVLAFCTAHLKTSAPVSSAASAVKEDASEGEQIKRALMAECAMRLLWMYQEALPEVVDEARFDMGKVLIGFDVAGLPPAEAEDDSQGEEKGEEEEEREEAEMDDKEDSDDGEDQAKDEGDQVKAKEPATLSTPARLHRLTQLHILRFIRASPAFSFTAPSPNYPGHTHLYSLLSGIVKLGTVRDQISEELKRLVQHILGKSIAFRWSGDQQGADSTEDGEVEAWIASLPVGLRRVREVKRLVDVSNDDGEDQEKTVTVFPETLDGTTLTDERTSVVTFLEDCVLRCSKTPYKYIEELEKMAGVSPSMSGASDSTSTARLPSPLFVTLVEQLEAKLISQGSAGSASLLTPSDVLAISVYLRALLFALVGKLDAGLASSPNSSNAYITVLESVLNRLDALLSPSSDVWEKAFSGEKHAVIRKAVEREVEIARRCLGLGANGDIAMQVEDLDEEEDKDVDDFLDLVEALEIPSPTERRLTIYELIDWVRLLGTRLNQNQTNRLWGAVEEVWPEGLGEVVKYLDVPDVRADAQNGVSVWEVLVKPESEESQGGGAADKMDVDSEEENAKEAGDDSDAEGSEDGDDFDPRSLPFEYLLVHALPRHLLKADCQEVLVECALSYCELALNSPSSPSTSTSSSTSTKTQRLLYIVRHVLRRIAVFLAHRQADATKDLLFVLGGILEKVKAYDVAIFAAVKDVVIGGLGELMATATSANGIIGDDALRGVRKGMLRLQEVVLESGSLEDRALVSEVAASWVDALKKSLGDATDAIDLEYAGQWIKFVQPGEVLELLREAVETIPVEGKQDPEATNKVMQWCLRALRDALKWRVGLAVHGQQSSTGPQVLELLFRLHSSLSSLRGVAKMDSEKERTIAMGVKTLEGLIAVMLEEDGLPVGLDGDGLKDSASKLSLSQVIANAGSRWTARLQKEASGNDNPSISLTSKSFLSQPLEEWTDATEKIARNFMYKKSAQVEVETEVLGWLVSEEGGARAEEVEGGERMIGVAHALLDCALHRGEQSSASPVLDDEAMATKLFEQILRHLLMGGPRRTQAKEGLEMLIELVQPKGWAEPLVSLLDQYVKALRKSVAESKSTFGTLTSDLISFADWVTQHPSGGKKGTERVQSIASDVVETGLQWLIRKLGEEEGQKQLEDETAAACVALAALLKRAGVACKSESLETLAGVVVQSQYHIAHFQILQLLQVGLGKASLKPLIVNKYLQGIIQHPHYFKLCAPASAATPAHAPLIKIRDSLIAVLHTLFFLHPANTCQVSHIEPLIRVYGGTLAVSDRKILSVFQLFERQRKLSVRSIIGRWAPPSSSLAGAVANGGSIGLEALQNLDTILVLRTGLAFPMWRSVDDDMDPEFVKAREKANTSESDYESQLYDPVFLLLLLQHVLANGPPASAIAWIELFRSNVVGLGLRALSAREGRTRELGMGCVVGLWSLMQGADLQEREYVLYLLGLLKNAIPPPPSKSTGRMNIGGDVGDDDGQELYPPRLPSYSTLLLFHALRGIFNPSTFVYPLTSRFLLQRPELDITDVPMLYNMLYSSDTDDWKKERGWIMRFLADGILTGSAVGDWRLLKRRHVWDLIASMYQGANTSASAFSLADLGGQNSGGDKAMKHGVLDFLANVTMHRSPTMSLVLKSGLLAWIDVQLSGPDRHAGNGVEWLRILENVLVVVDPAKMEGGSLKGQWARTIVRCVQSILKEAIESPTTLPTVFPLAVRTVVRLSLIPTLGAQSLCGLLAQCLEAMSIFETNVSQPVDWKARTAVPQFDDLVPPPRHSSHGLHDKLMFDEDAMFVVWGRCVESLWRAIMSADPGTSQTTSIWNATTTRLLIWRGLVGPEASPLGEWARVECVRNLEGRV